ncbi:MAG TPA: undecaprenyl-phosphate glucose phosphotransferase [Phycisphaerales bacterium]|nr:undecaprenyl-phosphate glucose phosphotransferase [Phycisphaerales bacterium]
MLRKQHRFFRSVLIAADAIIMIAASIVAYHIRFTWLRSVYPIPVLDHPTYATHAVPFLISTPLLIISAVCTGLYRARRDQRFFYEAIAILKAAILGLLLTISAVYLLRDQLYLGRNLSRVQYITYGVTVCSMLLAWRFAFRTGLRYLRSSGWNLRHVAVIGTGRLGQIVVTTLRRNSWTGIKPLFMVSHHDSASRETLLGLPVRGGLNDLESLLESSDLTGVVIALPADMGGQLPDLIARLERFPLDVRIVPDMNPRHFPINTTVSELDGMPVLSLRESPLSGWGRITKRAVDVIGALIALIIFALPMLFIAVITRLSGSGPVIFRQERMSLNGQRFNIYKFRTMKHVDAEIQALRDAGKGEDAWTNKNDVRVTRFGRLLRRTSLDELPQLFNVLIGEMSLVGPRPERPELITRFREDWRGYMLRQNVKAGITGWAQVNGLRGRTSLRKRLQYDLFYIRNWSLTFDLRILGLTLLRGFMHPNAN